MGVYESISDLKEREGWLDVISYGTTAEYPHTRGWGSWEGIREVIQNSLDEMQELTNVASYKSEVTADGISISDIGRGLGVHNLLIGKSEKPPWARGRFGEGLKIGLMTLLVRGYDVEVYSGSYYIKPKFADMKFAKVEPPGYFIEKIFVICYRAITPPVEGTIVKIKGLFDDYRERIALNLDKYVVFKAWTVVAGKTFYYTIMNLGPGRRKIFVKDIYVSDANDVVKGGALYSYNLVNVVLDESRRIPSSSSVFEEFGRIYAVCTNRAIWRDLLWLIKSGEEKLERHIELPYIKDLEVQTTIADVWLEVYGTKAVVMTRSDLRDYARWLGYEPIDLPYYYKYVLAKFIPTDVAMVNTFHEAKRGRVEEREYTPLVADRIGVAKLIAEELSVIYKRPAPSVEVWELPPGSRGEHHRDANRIVISKRIVDGPLYDFLENTMHELTHHYTGAEDGSPEMIRELGILAGHVNELLISKPELVTRIRMMLEK